MNLNWLLYKNNDDNKQEHSKIFYLYLFMIIALFVFPVNVYAKCNYEREAELSRIASNVQFSYNYEMINNYPEFTVNITNVSADIYIVDDMGDIFIYGKEFNPKYLHGKKVTYNIYSNDSNCKNEKILTKYINIPYFNQYSMLPECKEYSKFQLCSMWYNTSSYTEEEFYNELSNYKKISKPEDADEELNWFEKLKETFLEKTNFLYLILTFIGIGLLIVIFVVKKVRK